MSENDQSRGENRVRVAIATLDGDTIAPGHFAHSTHFMVVDIVGGNVKPIEYRENPFGYVPDTDAGGYEEHGGEYPYLHRLHRYHHLHGIEKYRTLREEVLSDVELIIAGGACRTSIEYFTSEGVKFIFADPGEPIGDIINFVSRLEIDKMPKIARLQRKND